MREATDALSKADLVRAERAIVAALAQAPQHADPKRLLGILLHQTNRPLEAVATFREALSLAPGDLELRILIAQAQASANDWVGALTSMRDVTADHPDAKTFYLLGRLLEQHGELEEALTLMQRALALDPKHPQARLQVARDSFYCGDFETAEKEFKNLIVAGQELASAWHGLAEMKTVKFTAVDAAVLKSLASDPKFAGLERATLLHALGKAQEDVRDYRAAFATYSEAAAIESRAIPWNTATFTHYVQSIREAFAEPIESAKGDAGREVIFIIGMPRSGSTLIEQILASHREVEGGSELPDLNLVVIDESSRRRAPLPKWVGKATPDDWQRLGADYLARTSRWRTTKPRFTDKSPGNWVLIEAVLAMLPGAKIIDCRRDAVETCWSCFKQFFAPGRAAWSSSFDDLAQYWKLYTSYCDAMAGRYPERVRIQSYEKLLGDPEAQTRELLAFCGLEFDRACLRPHDTSRTIRTASAAQVRKPLARGAIASDRYGVLLDPLRDALGKSRVVFEI